MTVLQLTSSEGKDENVEENLQSTGNMTAVEGTMGTWLVWGSGIWHERLGGRSNGNLSLTVPEAQRPRSNFQQVCLVSP